MAKEYKFVFEKHPAKKGTCPQCNFKDKLRYYEGFHGTQYGKCERSGNCGYHAMPPSEEAQKEGFKLRAENNKAPEPDVIYPEQKPLAEIANNHNSNFHKFCLKLGITHDHLKLWGIGTRDDKTIFLFKDVAGMYCNAKSFKFKEDGHRDKSTNSYSLKPYKCNGCGAAYEHTAQKCNSCGKNKTIFPDESKKFRLCIFGEHTWSEEKNEAGRFIKKLCLVESEKTAVIASFFYSQYDWGAYSAAKSLTDEKIGTGILFNRDIYNLRDADKAGREGHAEKQLLKWGITCTPVDLFKEREDGYDIADAIIDETRPVIEEGIIQVKNEEAEAKKLDLRMLLPEGVNINDFMTYGFFEHNGGYHSLNKDREVRTICEFTIKVLYLVTSKMDPKRIVLLKNMYGYETIVDLHTDAFSSLGNFKKCVEREGNYVFQGNETDLTRIKKKLFYEEKPSAEVRILGWQTQDKMYAFANGVCSGDQFHKADEYGIVSLEHKNYFLPFLSRIYRNDHETFEAEKRFRYKESKITFEEWAKLISQVYEFNGHIGICFYISSLFSDYIFDKLDCFPMLYLFGEPQSGKSTMATSFMSMFGQPQDTISLESPSSYKSIFRTLANFRNSIIWLDEYKNNIGKDGAGIIKGFWNRLGYKRAAFSNDTKTKGTPVLSAVMVSGQEMPNIDVALFTRCILLQFAKKDRDKDIYNRLMDTQKSGISNITAEILKHRQAVTEDFRVAYDMYYKHLTSHFIKNKQKIQERLIINMSAILAPVYLIAEKNLLQFPFTMDELLNGVIDCIQAQNNLVNNSDDSKRFWQIMEYLYRDGKIQQGIDFRFHQKNLYVRLGKIHPLYMEKHKIMYNLIGMDKATLEYYLKCDPAFLGQKSLRFQTPEYQDGLNKTAPTSCWGFKYDGLGIDIFEKTGINYEDDLKEELV
jgi:hypothetical protein